MNKTAKDRQHLIDEGKVWHVYFDGKHNEPPLFDGVKSHCMNFIRANGLQSAYKKGRIRVAKVIWELTT